MFRPIDITINAFFGEMSRRFLDLGLWKFFDDNYPEWFGGIGSNSWVEAVTKGWSPEWIIEQMDTANVEKAILVSLWIADGVDGKEMFVTAEEIAKIIDKYPDRFVGQVGLNPRKPIPETVRYLDKAVKDYGFKAAHVYPHWWGIPVYDKRYYPIYSKCVELDIPVCLQTGTQTMASRASLSCRPTFLDSVALDFPELRIVALHLGKMYEGEMVQMCWSHDNIYIGADVWGATTWDPVIVEYANTGGADRVMWGTDFPIQRDWVKSVEEVKKVIKSADAQRKILRDNAVKIYKL